MIDQRHPIPEVEKGLVMPKKVIDGRYASRTRVVPENPWIPFLKGLAVGDSFVVSHRSMLHVKSKAKELGIDLVWKTNTPRRYVARFWVYGVEGNRNPIYRREKAKLVEVESEKGE